MILASVEVPRSVTRRFCSLVLTSIVALTVGGLALGGCAVGGEEEPVCGDDICEDGETSDCSDCAEPDPEPVCGDGVCDEGEPSSCADCAQPDPVCGDGVCDQGELPSCADCAGPDPGPVCGNGLCEAGETTSCPDCVTSGDATLTVTNNSSYTAYYLYVAPCSASTWGDDQLGSNVLSTGESHQLTDIPPGCYDYRAETAGASTYWEEFGVELSAGENATWSITN